MTDFVPFCQSLGVLIDSLPPAGRWMRFPTKDKPHHKNASVKYLGDVGFVQDWQTMDEPSVWFPEGTTEAKRSEVVARGNREADRLAARAARKARAIIDACHPSTHPYLERKGFPDELVRVTDDGKLVVPMFNGSKLVGAQLIDADGNKKFIYGQRSGGAEFTFGFRGTHFLCEGFATGLSVHTALTHLKTKHAVHVAFSAGNMKKIAQRMKSGYVIADNDESGTGEKVAQEIGWPYWMSSVVGEDFNDTYRRLGIFGVAMQLRRLLTNNNLGRLSVEVMKEEKPTFGH